MELFSGLPSEFSLLLKLLWVAQELTNGASPITDTLATVGPILREVEILEGPHLIEVILDLLNASGGPVFDKVLHRMQGLVDSAPLFRWTVQLFPKMLHDLSVVVPKQT